MYLLLSLFGVCIIGRATASICMRNIDLYITYKSQRANVIRSLGVNMERYGAFVPKTRGYTVV